MTLSMHQASVPVFVRQLTAIGAILEKAKAYAAAKKIDPSVLINDRLAPDMLPLSKQIQIATDGAKGCVARLAGVDAPVYPDTEVTFADLEERITKTITFIQSIPAENIDGSENKEIVMKLGGNDMTFIGQPYLLHFVLPNFFFHVTMAYAILRHNGLEIGKRDFLGGV